MSQTQGQQGKEKGESRSKPITASGSGDEYKAPWNKIWDDVIRHEKVLDNIWKETWSGAIVPNELCPWFKPPKGKGKRLGDDAKLFFRANPSQKIPLKSSEVVGWRSSDPQNTLDYFGVKYVSQKIKFTAQEYGYYRHMKYLHSAKSAKPEPETPLPPPSKRIRHVVKCLLC